MIAAVSCFGRSFGLVSGKGVEQSVTCSLCPLQAAYPRLPECLARGQWLRSLGCEDRVDPVCDSDLFNVVVNAVDLTVLSLSSHRRRVDFAVFCIVR